MSYKIAILALVTLHALTAAALPPCTCTRNLTPVCGSDGNTYSNECILNCEKHKTGADITVARDGPCAAAEQICICTFEYKPVCGNDGTTYPNRCALLCERSRKPDIDVVSQGACSNEVIEPACICTDEIDEVCGSDGNTYSNPCQLNCATAKNPSLSVKSHGRCVDSVMVANPLPQVPPCICTMEFKEVCGSDGKTYANPCLLNCATAQDPSLRVQNEGTCDKVNVVNPVPQAPLCICTDELNEICGSDGKTYASPCLLNCATAQDPSLRVQNEGTCDKVNVVNPLPQAPPCICTDELNEICGSDGKTYASPCLLNCATAQNPSLSVQSEGKCDKVNVVNPVQGDQPQSCTCPRDLKPVCGTDGVTYNNECLLRCAGAQVSLARSAPCRL